MRSALFEGGGQELDDSGPLATRNQRSPTPACSAAIGNAVREFTAREGNRREDQPGLRPPGPRGMTAYIMRPRPPACALQTRSGTESAPDTSSRRAYRRPVTRSRQADIGSPSAFAPGHRQGWSRQMTSLAEVKPHHDDDIIFASRGRVQGQQIEVQRRPVASPRLTRSRSATRPPAASAA